MDNKAIDDVARAIHRQYAKEMLGEIQKWEKLRPDERSTWRLIARSTIALVQGLPVAAKSAS